MSPSASFSILVLLVTFNGCSAKNLVPTPPSIPHQSIQLLFLDNPELPETSNIATDLARHLGAQRIYLTYIKDINSIDTLDTSGYHGVYSYLDIHDPRVQKRFSEEKINSFAPDSGRSLVLVEAIERNRAFLTSKHAGIGPGQSVFTLHTKENFNWHDKEGLHLIIKNILKIAGDEVSGRWQAGKPAALTYTVPEVPIPHYEDPSDPPLKQNPLTPSQSLALTQVPVGFEAQLFAAEPDIVNPVAMNWDERGRLWVIETLDYPNNKHPLGQGNDSIKILEDTDHDGRADKVTIFAQGLSIATGFTFTNDGVIVSAPPEMLFLKDTDGDDVADEQTVLFDGFLTFDTHAGVSNLRYGFDNWIWMSIGYAGFEGIVGGTPHQFKQGLFRLKPDLSSLDYLSHFSNNTWGLGFSENGDVFGSTANNEHSAYLAIPDRYFAGVNGFDKSGYSPIASYKKIHPITEKVRQADVFGGYTAATGHAVYTAREFPEEYWNRAAFINEPTGHLVHRAYLRTEGTQFVAEDGWNMAASADEWASPVMAEVGPDGALWVLDWYNLIIQHNPVPEGFVAGEGDAYETPLRDQEHGRIYRIVYKDAPETTPLSLSKDNPNELVQALGHNNLFWRQTAQRLLVERGETDVVDDLLMLVQDQSIDKAGINGGAVHALWTLHGLGLLDGANTEVIETASRALSHPASGVRRAALQVLPADHLLWSKISSNQLLQDDEPLVILQALLKITTLPSDPAIGQALYALQNQPGIAGDAWLPTALAIAAAQHHKGYLEALLADANPGIQRDVTPVDVPNMSFEEADGNLPAGWSVEKYTWPIEETNPNIFTHNIVPNGRTGNALEISSPSGADVGVYVTVPVKPNTDYLLTGWIKTENLENMGGGYGAVIDILTFGRTRTIRGTSDWTWVERQFNAGSKSEVRIQCHLGRWGQYKGTAWFDDLRLVELGEISPSAVVAETIFRHIGAGGLAEPALAVIKGLPTAAPSVSDIALASFAENWPTGQRPENAPTDEILRASYASALSSAQQQQFDNLLARWAGVSPEVRDKPAGLVSLLLQTEVNTLKFVQDTLTVKAGQLVELTFENLDAMPHNVVFGQPGSLEIIGKAADALATSPDGLAKNYVPDDSNIISATALIGPGEQTTITFQVPTTPGEYPFVCTFPGHWRVMHGVLKVL